MSFNFNNISINNSSILDNLFKITVHYIISVSAKDMELHAYATQLKKLGYTIVHTNYRIMADVSLYYLTVSKTYNNSSFIPIALKVVESWENLRGLIPNYTTPGFQSICEYKFVGDNLTKIDIIDMDEPAVYELLKSAIRISFEKCIIKLVKITSISERYATFIDCVIGQYAYPKTTWNNLHNIFVNTVNFKGNPISSINSICS